ncbi:MAG: hypothetical protein AAGG09_08500 [Pseudomonadota bacterium]
MRRAYPILHLLLIAAMLVAAVAMANGERLDSGEALRLSAIVAI